IDLNDYTSQKKDSVRKAIRNELGINAHDPVILFVSMNFEIKGLDDIFYSLAKLKAQNTKFKLIVAGKGNIKKYTELAKEKKIISDIIFTGPVKKEKIIKLYLAGDFYMMLSKFDTFGNVVLEAMAVGLPVIVSGNVGAKDIVKEGVNGFIVNDTSDTDYIAAKITELLDEDNRLRMSEAAYQTAAQNTWDDVIKKYAAIYEEILSGKHS
ncbi:MAG TPA: glycosyltransferase family 4 protein, partial [Smithella sp.]|nr:glycosyltransferase family 4 protein [Smithella sp.]